MLSESWLEKHVETKSQMRYGPVQNLKADEINCLQFQAVGGFSKVKAVG